VAWPERRQRWVEWAERRGDAVEASKRMTQM
jgi:hypothetical protein